ncbi:MAG: response regulator transcription factor [Janthinobacterium lividum]
MGKSILILDNDPSILEVMEEALSYEGFCVNTFKETEDIISLVTKFKPDLVITDYILNGINGGELCKKIKNTSSTCHLPVIIISAYSKVLQSLGYYGCNAYVAKPFDLTEMIDLIKNLVETQFKMRINTPIIEY